MPLRWRMAARVRDVGPAPMMAIFGVEAGMVVLEFRDVVFLREIECLRFNRWKMV